MTFLSPEWLFLLPGLIALAWMKPQLKLYSPLRAALLLVLVLGMSRPVLTSGGTGRDIWLLVDNSDSLSGEAVRALPEIRDILSKGQGSHDRIYVVDYGRDAVRRDKGDPVFSGGTGQSRLGNALDYAMAESDAGRDNRFVILSDGYSTEPLGEAAEKLLKSDIRLDYRLMGMMSHGDVRVEALRVPARVLPGQAFLVEFALRGMGNKLVPWELTNGEKTVTGTARLENGQAYVRLTDRLTSPGAVSYEVKITPADDPIPQNNRARSWVEVTGGSDILLVSSYTNDPLADLLRGQGYGVRLVTDTGGLGLAHLTGMKLVILNNVPASRINPEFLKGLDFFVREQAGGLLMAGGAQSFNSGGYHATAVQDLLPVSMELKKDHRKLITAISYVMDRSGSMSMSTSPGVTKMDLANNGTVQSIEMMMPQDFVSVHAVDTSAHLIVPMSRLGEDVSKLTNIVKRIHSTGGGIYVYEGMSAGWKELQKVPAGTRHMVLFADANDSEQPGDYINLIDEMVAQDTTISVIALGSVTDSDADLLMDIANRGKGRIYFSESGADLPSIFSQETALVARSAFIRDPVALNPTPGWLQIAASPLSWPSEVDAYNLCYLREGATAAALSMDEYNAPLVAFWTRGSGRVAAVTFPLGGEHSERVRAWPEYGDFAQTLGRWLAGVVEPEGYSLRTRLDGDLLNLELLYSDQRTADISKNAPETKMEQWLNGQNKLLSPVWEKIEPGRFSSSLRMEPDSRIRGVVRIGESHLSFGPVSLTSDVEWAMDPRRVNELKQLSAMSGGGELMDFTQLWKDPEKKSQLPLLPWLLMCGLVLLLLEALFTRLGWVPVYSWKKQM